MKTQPKQDVKRIASFSVDHDKIGVGIYVSRIDGDVTTYDLRTRVPNGGDYLSDVTMHSVEHMLATYLRNSDALDVVYFGPMGCKTGFYLLVRNAKNDVVLRALLHALRQTIDHKGKIFGSTRKECGNYRCLSLSAAKKECSRYLKTLESTPQTFIYPQ